MVMRRSWGNERKNSDAPPSRASSTEHSGSSEYEGGSPSLRGLPGGFRESLHALSLAMEDGSIKINQYRMKKMLGQGSYANVYLGELLEDPDFKVAIKEFGKMRLKRTRLQAEHHVRHSNPRRGANMKRSDNDWEELENEEEQAIAKDPLYLIRSEVAIMKKLYHPNVLRLYEVLDDPANERLYMVFEYCPDGPVIPIHGLDQTTPLSEDVARDYFVQVLRGVDYLHASNIVHRDIKPDNVLLTDERRTCKIVDFGVSEMFGRPGDDKMRKTAGSPAFMSPAQCSIGSRFSHGISDDVWSLGATLYCMVVGHLPFRSENLYDMYQAIQRDEPEYPESLSPELRELLMRMLDKSEETRATIPEIRTMAWPTRSGTMPIEPASNFVEGITENDLQSAICRISSVFTVARAVSKFKRRSGLVKRSQTFSADSAGEVGELADAVDRTHLDDKGAADGSRHAGFRRTHSEQPGVPGDPSRAERGDSEPNVKARESSQRPIVPPLSLGVDTPPVSTSPQQIASPEQEPTSNDFPLCESP